MPPDRRSDRDSRSYSQSDTTAVTNIPGALYFSLLVKQNICIPELDQISRSEAFFYVNVWREQGARAGDCEIEQGKERTLTVKKRVQKYYSPRYTRSVTHRNLKSSYFLLFC